MALIKGSSQGGAKPKKAPAKHPVNGGHVGDKSLAAHYIREMGSAPTNAASAVGGAAIRAANATGGAVINGDAMELRAANAVTRAADKTGGFAEHVANVAGDAVLDAADKVGGAAINGDVNFVRAADKVGGWAETGVEKAVESLKKLGRHGNAVGPDDALGAGRIGKR